MISSPKIRSVGKRILAAAPVYRLMPEGQLRAFAATHYHSERSTPQETCRALEELDELPGRYHSSARAGAQAAFDAGRDDLAEAILAEAARRFPNVADVSLLRSEIRLFHGDYTHALSFATEARLLDPRSSHAASQVTWLRYLTEGTAASDAAAVEAVRDFPRWGRVLWTATRVCRTVDQFERFAHAWRSTVSEPQHVVAGVRPLAQAAARVGLLDVALELYAEAVLLWLHGHRPPPLRTSRTLENKDPLSAVADVCEALDQAGVPFFFAAGTALGLVRDGRPAGHDVDIDVGVFADDWDPGAIDEALRKHPRFGPNVAHPTNPKVASRHRGGAPIDVFRFYEEDGAIWHEGTFTRWSNTPFGVRRHNIRGMDVPLPEHEERYLEENYGPGWTEPDPGFDAFTDAPNVEVTWPEYMDYYRLRRAYLHLMAGEVREALGDVASVIEALRSTPSGSQLLDVLRFGHERALATPDVPFHLRDKMGAVARGAAPLEPTAAIAVSRDLLARHDLTSAAEVVEAAMRSGGWRDQLLWHERITLMRDPTDYEAIRQLFWSSPTECHGGIGALRAVARAACLAGEHDEGRALIRKAILIQAARRRGRRNLARRFGRDPGSRGPSASVSDRSLEDRYVEALRDLSSVMEATGSRWFLVAGTFLGMVREGTVIAWDKDIDLGFFSDEVDAKVLEQAFLKETAFSVRSLDLTTERLRVSHENGISIDLFPHYEESGRWWHDGAATRWWNTSFELTEADFLGVRILVPADADRYLTESYGEWRRPDPSFDARLDAPNVEVTDREYFDSLQFFDLLRAIETGDQDRATRHASVLKARGEGSWLDRI